MGMKVIAIEGCHGSGKSKLAQSLSKELNVELFKHTGPRKSASIFEAAMWYGVQRATLYSKHHDRVIVADRWHWSTTVVARALYSPDSREYRALMDLANAERLMYPDPILTLVCEAPWDVCRERVLARGEAWTMREMAERVEIADLAHYRSWPVLNTAGDHETVVAAAVQLSRGTILKSEKA